MQQLTQLKITPLGRTGLEITRRAIAGLDGPPYVEAILDAGRLELTDADLADSDNTNRPGTTR
jgi:hypothetical protein